MRRQQDASASILQHEQRAHKREKDLADEAEAFRRALYAKLPTAIDEAGMYKSDKLRRELVARGEVNEISILKHLAAEREQSIRLELQAAEREYERARGERERDMHAESLAI